MSNVQSAICSMSSNMNRSRGRRGIYGREKDQSSVSSCFTSCCGKRKYVLCCLHCSLETCRSFPTVCSWQYCRINPFPLASVSASFSPSHDGQFVGTALGKYRAATSWKHISAAWRTRFSVTDRLISPHHRYWHMGSLPLLSAFD